MTLLQVIALVSSCTPPPPPPGGRGIISHPLPSETPPGTCITDRSPYYDVEYVAESGWTLARRNAPPVPVPFAISADEIMVWLDDESHTGYFSAPRRACEALLPPWIRRGDADTLRACEADDFIATWYEVQSDGRTYFMGEPWHTGNRQIEFNEAQRSLSTCIAAHGEALEMRVSFHVQPSADWCRYTESKRGDFVDADLPETAWLGEPNPTVLIAPSSMNADAWRAVLTNPAGCVRDPAGYLTIEPER